MFSSTRPWRRGEPAPQAYYTFRDGLWWPVEVEGTTVPPGAAAPRSFTFTVLSWNIDFMRRCADARMAAALDHLHGLVRDDPNPVVVMLNEITRGDLVLIKKAEWVREGYNITDVGTDHWESSTYGTCMLLPHTLPLSSLFRVHYPRTSMQRDALIADVALPPPASGPLRLCTSHLESLQSRPPARPAQLAAAASYLREAYAGVMGGDFNAIEEFDKELPGENGLKDAYLEMGGVEGEEGGMTWGQMAPRWDRERWGLSRMDKIVFCGGVEVVSFGRFGMDVVAEGEEVERELGKAAGLERPWVTDHLGVRAEFRVDVGEGESKGEGEGDGKSTKEGEGQGREAAL
ncbi:be34ec7d-0e68-46fe-bb6a-05f4e13c29ca [Staphylotrichum tortipilum]|uniref:Be34ec7d-0e68-46fe-bb6a-05f4e13c29ca n=1 Tax=Staphylotrichum tortipilum TaxID=2831512 RepID=A0AAN6MDM8_9PEZI|nr:be34ec7d-0e68-46fe-bb6a-05f4e13c29ca [Staphylotrichum longicolle]